MESFTVSVNDACRLLGIGRTKFYELVADQSLATVRIGRRRLVKVASLRALVGEGA